MGDCKLFRAADGSLGSVDVDSSAFGTRSPRRVQREAVLMYQANMRSGTASTKTRAEIQASIKKPWKQKGSGRARAGRKSSPIWRGGGIAHGPRPRSYTYHLPRKALRAATRAAIAGKFLDGEVMLADSLSFDAPSTRTAAKMLAALGADRGCLVVTAERNENAWKSLRNLPRVTVMQASDVNAYEVLLHRNLLVTQESLEALRARVGSTGEYSA